MTTPADKLPPKLPSLIDQARNVAYKNHLPLEVAMEYVRRDPMKAPA